MWRSLVARVVRDDEVAGSNPVTPTIERPVTGAFLTAACVEITTENQGGAPETDQGQEFPRD